MGRRLICRLAAFCQEGGGGRGEGGAGGWTPRDRGQLQDLTANQVRMLCCAEDGATTTDD